MVSESLGKPVWELFDVPEPYLDFQLNLETKYPKGSLKYESKAAKDEKLSNVVPLVEWANKLSGKALQRFFTQRGKKEYKAPEPMKRQKYRVGTSAK